MAIAYFKTKVRKEEISFCSTCSITVEWSHLLIGDVKPCEIIGSITEEM